MSITALPLYPKKPTAVCTVGDANLKLMVCLEVKVLMKSSCLRLCSDSPTSRNVSLEMSLIWFTLKSNTVQKSDSSPRAAFYWTQTDTLIHPRPQQTRELNTSTWKRKEKVTQTQQQRLESPTVTLSFLPGMQVNTRYIIQTPQEVHPHPLQHFPCIFSSPT